MNGKAIDSELFAETRIADDLPAGEEKGIFPINQ